MLTIGMLRQNILQELLMAFVLEKSTRSIICLKRTEQMIPRGKRPGAGQTGMSAPARGPLQMSRRETSPSGYLQSTTSRSYFTTLTVLADRKKVVGWLLRSTSSPLIRVGLLVCLQCLWTTDAIWKPPRTARSTIFCIEPTSRQCSVFSNSTRNNRYTFGSLGRVIPTWRQYFNFCMVYHAKNTDNRGAFRHRHPTPLLQAQL